jgi:Copper type II ascorbate-dependent monooxygenase, C-terminal domain
MAMRRTSILSATLLLTAAACNSSVAATDNTGGSSTGAPATSTTGTTSSSGGTGGGSGSTVTLTMDSFSVPAGGEVYYCQNYANPFGGKDAYVQEFESHMAAESHHMLLFYKPGISADGPLETCSGLEFAATPYGSQTLNDSLTFPPGVAAIVPAMSGTGASAQPMGLRIQSHYLNTTSSTVNAHVELIFHMAEASTVKYPAGVLFVIDTDIDVPPAASTVNTDDCTIPQDMNVLRTSSHMHMHGTNFVATVAGNTVYETNSWSDPKPDLFSPAMVLKQGDPLHFACSFTNNGTMPLTFGESALTNEMCIFTASFYPTTADAATIDASGCVTQQN